MPSKTTRHEAYESNSELIAKFCDKYGFKYKFLNKGYQIRIEGALDVYPVRARWHWLATNERGDFEDEEDLRQVLLDRLPKAEPEKVTTANGVDSLLEVDLTKKVRQTKERDEYFCIKHAFIGLHPSDPSKYSILGLGTDDKIYEYVKGEWREQ